MHTDMFCNCRFRKPFMLLLFVGFTIFVNYTVIGWAMGPKTVISTMAPQVTIDSDYIGRQVNLSPFARSRSRTHLPHQIAAAAGIVLENVEDAREKTFFDQSIICALVEEEEKIKNIEKLDVVPAILSDDNNEPIQTKKRKIDNTMGMLDDMPPVEELIRKKQIIQAEEDIVDGGDFNLSLDLGHLKEGLMQDINEAANDFAPKVDYRRMNSRQIDLNGPFSNPIQPKFRPNFIDEMESEDDFDDAFENYEETKEEIFLWDVKGKIQVDLDEREFAGTTFEPGHELVKNMMKHAWKGYKDFAWGMDELKPWSKKGKNMLGTLSFGLTAIDALDTLYLMEMYDEFKEAANFIINDVDFNKPAKVSLFEFNIRVLGGLLSAYALSGDERLLKKAEEVGDLFMPAFTSTFPSNDIALGQQKVARPSQFYGTKQVSLAQVGTFSLEFGYLSHLTGKSIYRLKAEQIIKEISEMETTIPGLYPSHIFTGMAKQGMEVYTLAGEADSFYEYLLKYWLITGKKDKLHHELYTKAVPEIKNHLIYETDGKKYFVAENYGYQSKQLEHLACFAPGMLGLGAVNEGDKNLLALAEELTETCYLSYHQQVHGIGCEVVSIPDLIPVRHGDHYILRPEVIESIFIMWRLTKNPKYRKWGYEIAQNIDATCKVPTGGYAGVRSVNNSPVPHHDTQESFFLAETLKYLYLLFSSDDVIPLDKWVFNTEAHPLPVYG